MLGNTPAVAALAAVLVVFAGAGECAAQSASPTAPSAQSEAAKFNAWRDSFRARALKAGIPHDVFEKALGGVRPDPTVHEKNEDQPEFTRQIWDYLDGALSETRVKNGRKMLQRHASLLADAERKWGVPRQFLVAIWGMETSYGALLGNHNVFEALATLSYRGERTDYGEEQLLAALRLLADGNKPREAMTGSWAGAVGHTQFVPTTYLKYAVDGDKDGRRDLWDSLSDVFHSTAHYLKKSGFDGNLKWGREAFLPDDFEYALAGYHVSKPLSEWRELGIRMANGSLVPDLDIKASILVPAGHQGPAFLIYENFNAILAYNQSTSYALAIGLLSDQLRGGPSLKKSWPRHLKPLGRDQRLEIQRRLKTLGYEITKVDGVLGRETRGAIQAFQRDQGDIADGYATTDLLAKLRAGGPARTASAENPAAESAPAPEERSRPAEVTMASAESESAETRNRTEAESEAAGEAEAKAGGQRDLEVKTQSGGGSESVDEVIGDTEVTSGSGADARSAGHPAPESVEGEPVAAAVPAEAAEAGETARPRGKPAQTEADRPFPRAKPQSVAAEPSPPAHASAARETAGDVAPQPGKRTTPLPKPDFAGVTSALAAPGLTILGNGVAAPLPRPNRAAIETSVDRQAPQVPLNNGNEPIVSPPGVAYVGAEEEAAEQAEAGTTEDESDVSEKPEAPSGSDPGS